MNCEIEKLVDSRLARIEGQVKGIRKMVLNDRYCVDILIQTSAIISALKKVEDIIMENNLNSCGVDGMKSKDLQLQNDKISEVMDLISKFRKQ